MEEFLKQLMGKKVDIWCGTNRVVRGDIVDVKSGILFIRDEDESISYVAVDKISIVCEVKDAPTRPGFVV